MGVEEALFTPRDDELALGQDDRLDVPGVLDEHLLVGSVKHSRDERLMKHMNVTYVLDAENPRKRSAERVEVDPSVSRGQIELDDDFTFETFKENIIKATDIIREARAHGETVFVFCTHGNNESTVVCMAYLMIAEGWSLERSYKHVIQKRPATAPRRAYIEHLRILEREVHGYVTLRSASVGPSMIDLMHGLRGESRLEDADETSSQTSAPDGRESTLERASFISNFSMTTGLHNGSSLRETMIIAERDDEGEASVPPARSSSPQNARNRGKANKKDCIIS